MAILVVDRVHMQLEVEGGQLYSAPRSAGVRPVAQRAKY